MSFVDVIKSANPEMPQEEIDHHAEKIQELFSTLYKTEKDPSMSNNRMLGTIATSRKSVKNATVADVSKLIGISKGKYLIKK